MTTAQKLQEIISKGGFEAKVAASILASENFKCSWKQWEIIRCSHDELDFSELNSVNINNLKSADFQNWNQAEIDRAKRNQLN